MRRLTFLCLTLALAPCFSRACAEELLSADKPIPEVIDHYIDAQLSERSVKPAPLADDATILRRTTLDLVGRIPTAGELKSYLESRDPAKRTRMVDRLMSSPGFIRHQVNEFDAMLMEGTRGSLRDYLTVAFKEDRSWERIFRDLVLPDQNDPLGQKAREFLRQRVRDTDQLTNSVSVLFFGVNVSCAKCHDHPLVMDWKQDHFYGMKSFLDRTFDAGGYVGEQEVGLVKFKTTKGQQRTAKMMFLTGKTVETDTLRELSRDEQKKFKSLVNKYRKKKQPPPTPKFSARGALVDLALQPDQRHFFARSIVNRLWARLHGLGLVNPLDQMHSANFPTHPNLLDWLARDTANHKYDLRRLIRGLVLSNTYARSSKWEGPKRPRPQTFGVAQVRPLTPDQLAVSLRLATTAPDQFPTTLKPKELTERIERVANSARGFASQIERARDEDFQISVDEALLFTNSDRIQREFLSEGRDRLIGALKEIKDHQKGIDLAVHNVLSRTPTTEEVSAMEAYLRTRKDRQAQAYQQLVWALLTTSEFRFNH